MTDAVRKLIDFPLDRVTPPSPEAAGSDEPPPDNLRSMGEERLKKELAEIRKELAEIRKELAEVRKELAEIRAENRALRNAVHELNEQNRKYRAWLERLGENVPEENFGARGFIGDITIGEG